MRKKSILKAREWLLLSAYLDGELSKHETHQVKELLQSKPASQMALEGLRRTRQVLHFLPQRKVPRSFALTPEMIKKTSLSPITMVFSYASALAGFLLVAVVAFDLFAGYSQQPSIRAAQDSQAIQAPAQESAEAEIQAEPQIIYWGPASPLPGAFGLGGGGDEMGAGLGGGIGGGRQETAIIEEAAPAQEKEVLPEQFEAPLAAPSQEQAESEAAEALEPLAEINPAEKTSVPLEGSQPILGIRPAAERGSLLYTETAASQAAIYPQSMILRLLELSLAAIAIIGGFAALLSKRASRNIAAKK